MQVSVQAHRAGRSQTIGQGAAALCFRKRDLAMAAAARPACNAKATGELQACRFLGSSGETDGGSRKVGGHGKGCKEPRFSSAGNRACCESSTSCGVRKCRCAGQWKTGIGIGQPGRPKSHRDPNQAAGRKE